MLYFPQLEKDCLTVRFRSRRQPNRNYAGLR